LKTIPLWLAEQSAMVIGKIRHGWRKNPLHSKNSRSGGKFHAMLNDKFPGKFHSRQVLVLWHACSTYSEII
jgi:hypothetical protein